MSRAGNGRFQKGQSGNPSGRPKARRPNNSAFDIILNKSLTVTRNGAERELTVEEALELQTYQAALGGSRMARVRKPAAGDTLQQRSVRQFSRPTT